MGKIVSMNLWRVNSYKGLLDGKYVNTRNRNWSELRYCLSETIWRESGKQSPRGNRPIVVIKCLGKVEVVNLEIVDTLTMCTHKYWAMGMS